jgi:hypothetical protein
MAEQPKRPASRHGTKTCFVVSEFGRDEAIRQDRSQMLKLLEQLSGLVGRN